MWKIKLMKRSKSTESLSNRRIRVGEVSADEKSKKVPVAPKRARKPEKPVVPPRPTEKALANAKCSPTRSQYVELDLSGCHTAQQGAGGKDPSSQKLVQNSPPVKDRTMKATQTTTVTYAASKLTQRSPQSSRETLRDAQMMQSDNATTAQCATRTASENSPSSATVQRSPSWKENTLDDHTQKGSSSTLPRAAPRRATVPQVVKYAASSAQFNSRRDRKVTVINSKEAEYRTGTSWLSRTAKSRAYRNCASTKSEYYSPEDIRHSRPSRPPSLQVAATGATSLRPTPSAKRSYLPTRPEPPPKHKLERPLPLPKDKLVTQSLPPSPLISRQQNEADIVRTDNEYEYIHFEPRHVIMFNGSANANLYTDNAVQSEYDVPAKGLPKTLVSDGSTKSTSAEGEIYYTTMNPVIPDSVECNGHKADEIEEDEYILPETSVDYVNVPGTQIPTSPLSYDSGVCCSQESNTVDESPHIGPEAQSPAKIEPYAEIRRAS